MVPIAHNPTMIKAVKTKTFEINLLKIIADKNAAGNAESSRYLCPMKYLANGLWVLLRFSYLYLTVACLLFMHWRTIGVHKYFRNYIITICI